MTQRIVTFAPGIDDDTLNRGAERAWSILVAPVDYRWLLRVAAGSGLASLVVLGAIGLLAGRGGGVSTASALPPLPTAGVNTAINTAPLAIAEASTPPANTLKPGDCRDFTTALKARDGVVVIATGRACVQPDGQVSLVGTPSDVPMVSAK